MRHNKIRLELFLIFVILLLFIGLNAYGFYKTEYVKKPAVKDKIESFDANYLYNFYIASAPNTQGRDYFGSPNASITIIAFLDINSQSSKNFIADIFPKLQEEYIGKGRVRFYHKNYITANDFAEKNDNFLYAMYLSCAKFTKKDYHQFYFELFKTDITDIKDRQNLLKKYSIYKNCQNTEFRNARDVIEDISEVENFGIVGINPRFYIGLNGKSNTVLDGVKYNKIKKTIRQYELIKGE